MILRDIATEVIKSPKTAGVVASITATMGAFLESIPDEVLAKLATLLGILLTSILIVVQFYKLRSEKKKQRLMELQLQSLVDGGSKETQ